MAKAILTFQSEAKKAIESGGLLEDVVNVPARLVVVKVFVDGLYVYTSLSTRTSS